MQRWVWNIAEPVLKHAGLAQLLAMPPNDKRKMQVPHLHFLLPLTIK